MYDPEITTTMMAFNDFKTAYIVICQTGKLVISPDFEMMNEKTRNNMTFNKHTLSEQRLMESS